MSGDVSGVLRGTRALVTGPAGFVGSHLTRALVQHEADVHVLVRPSTRPWRLAGVLSRLTVHYADLGDAGAVAAVVDTVRPERVFHLAAASGHGLRAEERREAVAVTIGGTLALLEALCRHGAPYLIHVASSLEYGRPGRAIVEDDVLRPASFRGVAKAAATMLCLHFADSGRLPVTVLRPFSVYGPWEEPRRFVPTAIRALSEGGEIQLTSDRYQHDLIFVEDVVDACLLAAVTTAASGEVINVGSGAQVSAREIVRTLSQIMEKTARIASLEYAPAAWDSDSWMADITKARRLLGWSPRHSLREGLAACVAWWQSQPLAELR